ncbi:hypothetical protein BDQ17DRAFT_1406138 [Cyathus striatus]|nr:hypothetical protein BDQ17DRAFT_1406138 [Cyathus striatus]
MSQPSTESPVLKRTATTVTFAQQQPHLLVTAELDRAIEECREKVKQISEECRMKNCKFRDIEFDLEHDKDRCLHGAYSKQTYKPSDVQRVTQIFEKPRFYAKDGSTRASDIIQGALGDCWLMSALATVSSCPGLIEKFCVERDEEVGVYGFIFFKNNTWVDVIVDDLLFTLTPKYEELSSREQGLYHYDKEAYNKSARKGGKQLYFAKSGDEGETWVPLLEKAYAKLHGTYSSISGGWHCEAVEDMTGGVSSFVQTRNILDVNRFWEEELSRVNKDRLFGCSLRALSSEGGRTYQPGEPEVQGLKSNHAYSVLRAIECKGKRFVVVRNPWGKTEWKGPWSDGSKEWQGEWLEALPLLGHVFGDDGQFIMEYKDFLDTWQDIGRTILFDASWIMSSQWLRVSMDPLPNPWRFGDVSFEFSLSAPTLVVIVLSQLDRRYFDFIAGRSRWCLDFVLVKEGEKKPRAVSNHAWYNTRSVNLEVELEAGKYYVYVRIDRWLDNTHSNTKLVDAHLRPLSRLLTDKLYSQSIATNLDKGFLEKFTTTTVSELIQKAYEKYEKKLKEKEEVVAETENEDEKNESGDESSDEVTTTTTTTTVVVKKKPTKSKNPSPTPVNAASNVPKPPTTAVDDYEDAQNPDVPITTGDSSSNGTKAEENPYNKYLTEDDNVLFLGLKVYTKKDVPVTIVGKLKADLEETDKKEASKAS